MPKISFQKGAIHLVIILLALVGLAVFASVSIFAKSRGVKRSLDSKYFSKSTPRPSRSIPPSAILPTGPCYPIGDVNNDGKVNNDDAQKILNHVAGLGTVDPYKDRADVNKDGAVTAVDAQLIKQYLAGSINTFAACQPPTISSVVPTPFRVEADQFVSVYGMRFGSTRGKVTFTFLNRTYDCGFSAKAAWYDSNIICSVPIKSPVNQTVKVSVISSDGRVSAPYNVWTGIEATSSATPSARLK